MNVPRLLALFVVVFSLCTLSAAESPQAPPTAEATDPDAASQEILRAYLQLQEQLHTAQLAIERARMEMDEAATRNAAALTARLRTIEESLASQRVRELEAMQSSNRTMLLVAGTFAGFGFLAMLFTAYFHWRAMNRLSEVSGGFSLSPALGAGSALATIGPGDAHLVSVAPVEQSNTRLLGAIDRLEKRILELEQTAHHPLRPSAEGSNGAGAPGEGQSPNTSSRIGTLLGKGQALLNLDQAEEALVCFDEVLALDPNHAEGLVKKGTALERLRKLNEAIECYDRAIEADQSMTMAYLCKGGLFNRMERFSEALECYEQALRTQKV
jgi:tetratricopeptide (TPR) repeat protein